MDPTRGQLWFSSFFLRVQLSQPYVAIGHTSASRIFIEIGMLRLFHIFCSDAAIACPLFNLVRNSIIHSPSSVIRDPRYGNVSTCSSSLFRMRMRHAMRLEYSVENNSRDAHIVLPDISPPQHLPSRRGRLPLVRVQSSVIVSQARERTYGNNAVGIGRIDRYRLISSPQRSNELPLVECI